METRRGGSAFPLIAALLLLIARSASCAASKDTLGIAPQGMALRNLFRTLVRFTSLLPVCGTEKGIPSSVMPGVQDMDYYRTNVIKCKDGSSKFTKEQLNDEFCDCPDGTDEPGLLQPPYWISSFHREFSHELVL